MGVYDSVRVPCPRCGEKAEFQSKGSEDRCCRSFELGKAPDDVMSDVNRHSPHYCVKCSASFYVDEVGKAILF